MKSAAAGAALLMALLAAAPTALAHHSFAVFDHSRQITLNGVVKAFQWTNPHTWIQLVVTDADGKTTEWSLEGGSPNILGRNGWKRTSLEAGDRVSVLLYPMKSGEPGGSFLEVHKADGAVLYYHG
jgi:hypothetical protein